jgi:hypothetical protein
MHINMYTRLVFANIKTVFKSFVFSDLLHFFEFVLKIVKMVVETRTRRQSPRTGL